MEMRKNNFEEFKEMGQVIRWEKFENDFLRQSIEGVKVVKSNGQVRRDVPYEEIINELKNGKNKIIYYIEKELAVKIIHTDGKYEVFYRE